MDAEVKETTQAVVKDTRKPVIPPKEFSGVLHTLVYRPHEGFADYAVATVTVEKGQVKQIDLSDPYCAIEARDKMDALNRSLLEKLRRAYPAGFRHVL